MFRAPRLRSHAVFMVPILILVLLLPAAGCGDDDPAKPKIIPEDQDGVPEIPVLADDQVDPPSRSETLVVLKPAPDYCPAVLNVQGNMVVDGQAKYETLSGAWVDCYGNWMNGIHVGFGWLDQVPPKTVSFDACGLVSRYTGHDLDLVPGEIPSTQRVVLMREKGLIDQPESIGWTAGFGASICRENIWPLGCTSRVALRYRYTVDGQALDETPYIRRDRFWQSVPWESGNYVERMTGSGSITGTSSYTQGSSTTETESMAYTLGAEIGAAGEVLSASVSASLTQTFSTSVTVSESETRSFSRQLDGTEGKRTCFVLWVLYDQYSFAHEDGTPFTDPNYEFDPGTQDTGSSRFYNLQVAGGQAEATAYVFDMDSGKLEQMVSVK